MCCSTNVAGRAHAGTGAERKRRGTAAEAATTSLREAANKPEALSIAEFALADCGEATFFSCVGDGRDGRGGVTRWPHVAPIWQVATLARAMTRIIIGMSCVREGGSFRKVWNWIPVV